MGEAVKTGASVIGKVYKILWLITVIGFIVVVGGFYLEFRKLTGQVAKVEAMVNAIGEKVIGAAEWKEKAQGQLDELKEKAGGLLDKLPK
jgi:hypothetical protein